MKLSKKVLHPSAIAASLLLLQPVEAQAPGPPAAGSAAAADAAQIQQQASDAFARALDAALKCDRDEYARQIALLESLNAQMAEVSANAAAGARTARRIPTEFGGAPQAGGNSIAQAENVVRQLLAHARGLVPRCPDNTATAPPADDIPTLEAGPLPPGSDFPDKNAEFYFPKPTADNPNPTGWIRVRVPESEYELWRRYGHLPIPPETGEADGKTPEMGGADGGSAAPPEKPNSGSAGAASQPPNRAGDPQDGAQETPGPVQPKEDAPKPSGPSEGAANTTPPVPPTPAWPTKTSASDLKARNSETAVELLEPPPSRIEICEGPEAPEAECGNQQPPPRKLNQREKRDPR